MNKTEQLIDAIDHPENYSDEELKNLLCDPEAREAYDAMCSMKAALSPKPESDIDKEWQIFRERNLSTHSSRKTFGLKLRYAKMIIQNSVAVVALCILSVAAIATVIGVRLNERQNPAMVSSDNTIDLTQATTTKSVGDTASIENTTIAKQEPVLFENCPLEEILNTMKEHYQVEVIFESQKAKNLRLYFNWNPELPIADIVTLLNNFQQFSIRLSSNTLIVE